MTVWEELKARGLIAQVTDEDEIKEMVNNGKATFYIGFDPTADSLHVGHFMALCLMKRLQMAGNRPIALLGGGTDVYKRQVFGPVVLLALFWRRSNWQGALAGMICGGSMVFIWKYGISTLGGAWGIYELLPAFLVAIAANIIVSLITKAPSKEITDEFDLVNQK